MPAPGSDQAPARSTTSASIPRCSSARAVASPAIPPPTTRTRCGRTILRCVISSRGYGCRLYRGENLPCVRDAFQRVCSMVDELEAGTGNKISHRARDEHLARPRERNDARGDVDADSRHAVAAALDLAGV